MCDEEKISANIKFINLMNQDGVSLTLDEYWDEIVAILSKDIEDTREWFMNASKEEIEHISGCFGDISYIFQSKEFIKILEATKERYPDIDIDMWIEWAKDTILD